MSATLDLAQALTRGACPECSTRTRIVFHYSGCPFHPPACASCGARWMEDRGSRMLEHAPGCAYVEAMAS